ncbi:hypothetical protein Tco_1413130, partial [Tanacetum coccineum]
MKARLNFEGCSRKRSKIQEVSQHSESRTPNLRVEHERRRRSRRSRSMSKIPEPTSVFSRLRRHKSKSPRHRDSKREAVFTRLGREEKAYSIGWEVKEEVCLHARVAPNHNDTGTPKGKRRAITKAPVQEKHNPFPESITIKECLHKERKRSQKVKIAEEDSGSEDRKNKSQALKKTTYPNYGEDPKDRLKNFQAAFNFMITGSARVWFDDLPPESVDNYDDLKKIAAEANL